MALEDDIAAMNRNRVQRGMCLTVDDLAMQVQSHQSYLTNIVNELVEQIDIIETGGGVKVVIGQATAAVTGSDFQIDNIVSLTDGFTAPSAPLDVVNILGFSCNDNTYVYAVLNPATDEWLGWTDTGGVGDVLLIGGLTTATVDSLDTTFTIDTIISFTSGYTHATSPQTVVNTFGRDLANNQPVYAIYRPDNDTWETWVDTDLSGGGAGSYLAGYGLTLTGGDTFSLVNTDYDGSTDSAQVLGDYEGTPGWFGMASIATAYPDGSVTDNTDFELDRTTVSVLSGIDPRVDYPDPTPISVVNTLKLRLNSTTKVYAIRDSSGVWQTLAEPLRRAEGLAVGNVFSTDATFEIDEISPIYGERPGVTTLEIQNSYGFNILDNDKVLVEFWPVENMWVAVQAKCPSE